MKPIIQFLLAEFGGKVITREELERLASSFNEDLDYLVNYLIQYGYVVRILRGLYYVKTPVEFSTGGSPSIYRLLALGMNKLTRNWYFGLFTALILNGLTHEGYTTVFVINDRIARPRPIHVNGTPVRIIKSRRDIFDFGIVIRESLRFSDLEKTLLDFLYFANYGTIPKNLALRIWREYQDRTNKDKLQKYLERYPRSIRMVIGNGR
ncbi:type IV toxin-antitoxin system AbiEi family antitoxin domain-containing protein [Thermococcus sp.]